MGSTLFVFLLMKLQTHILILQACWLSALLCFSCSKPKESRSETFLTQSDQVITTQDTKKRKPLKSPNRRLEIPAYLTDREEEIVYHTDFTLSYNRRRLLPNWVAWKLTPTRFKGKEQRAENFQPDFTIQHGPIAYDSDYRQSGYSRGHMCPAADCKHSRAAMNECFLLSNICPQNKEFNAGDWAELESICRHWANVYDSIFVVCGPVVEKNVQYQTIGKNRVTVPQRFFKVVMRWNGRNRADAIGFIYDNHARHHEMSYYAVSVDEVEQLTGIDFYPQLPKDVERRAEATFDTRRWKGMR